MPEGSQQRTHEHKDVQMEMTKVRCQQSNHHIVPKGGAAETPLVRQAADNGLKWALWYVPLIPEQSWQNCRTMSLHS